MMQDSAFGGMDRVGILEVSVVLVWVIVVLVGRLVELDPARVDVVEGYTG